MSNHFQRACYKIHLALRVQVLLSKSLIPLCFEYDCAHHFNAAVSTVNFLLVNKKLCIASSTEVWYAYGFWKGWTGCNWTGVNHTVYNFDSWFAWRRWRWTIDDPASNNKLSNAATLLNSTYCSWQGALCCFARILCTERTCTSCNQHMHLRIVNN